MSSQVGARSCASPSGVCPAGGLLMVPVGVMVLCWPGDGPFRTVGEGRLVGRPRTLPSEVYPAGKLQ